jgi:hypothetical protein
MRTSRSQTGSPKWDAEPRGRGGNAEKRKERKTVHRRGAEDKRKSTPENAEGAEIAP